MTKVNLNTVIGLFEDAQQQCYTDASNALFDGNTDLQKEMYKISDAILEIKNKIIDIHAYGLKKESKSLNLSMAQISLDDDDLSICTEEEMKKLNDMMK